jgi:hypothetical protein
MLVERRGSACGAADAGVDGDRKDPKKELFGLRAADTGVDAAVGDEEDEKDGNDEANEDGVGSCEGDGGPSRLARSARVMVGSAGSGTGHGGSTVDPMALDDGLGRRLRCGGGPPAASSPGFPAPIPTARPVSSRTDGVVPRSTLSEAAARGDAEACPEFVASGAASVSVRASLQGRKRSARSRCFAK